MGRAVNTHLPAAVRLSKQILSPYVPPLVVREGMYLLAGMVLFLLPLNLLTMALFLVLLTTGMLTTRKYYQQVGRMLLPATAVLDALGAEGVPLVLAEMSKHERTIPQEDLHRAVGVLLSRPSQQNCAEGHAPNCAHRPLLQTPPQAWWPVGLQEATSAGGTT